LGASRKGIGSRTGERGNSLIPLFPASAGFHSVNVLVILLFLHQSCGSMIDLGMDRGVPRTHAQGIHKKVSNHFRLHTARPQMGPLGLCHPEIFALPGGLLWVMFGPDSRRGLLLRRILQLPLPLGSHCCYRDTFTLPRLSPAPLLGSSQWCIPPPP